ncbi:DNA-3-methyladenine glycosylase 2 family protein [Mesobaculum littorinae]|uniref:DNA-3-methyladenine glycosylase II n=1 Tax=Mesobaculum littorinae TaxID=2486419 RepID=A0A438AMU2_9RHOB|nr:DNA-3-methyladenine glycosylase [Mesobaculum littorinae]RVV99866.1 DNA-3-methyladenine glycosylase 2 family protein [Mesobaculum littorinae]
MSAVGRLIEGPACLEEGAAALVAVEPRFANVLACAGPLPLRRRPEGFGALADAVLGQQISVGAAAAIRARLEGAGLLDPVAIVAAGEEALTACGVSRPKARYLQGIAAAAPDYDALRDLPDAEVVARLTALPGIGRWTAEIYAMFALGRADVLAAGDLALQEAARRAFDLPHRPREPELRRMAQAWSPWRGVAARALWAYYRHETGRKGIG